jgi:hypothetical protein
MQSASDPLGYDVPLPLSARYHPLGFPLIVETNCAAILEIAEALWSRWPVRDGRPARFQVFVADSDSRFPLTPGMPRGRGHLVSVVHSPENFATCDLTTSFSCAWLTRDVVATAEYFSYHFLEPLAWLMIDAAHLAPLHASCVAWEGSAVVMCGESGAGKTSLAYACARRGWTYLSDDATHIIRERPEPWVAGRPFRIRFRESARDLFPELKAFTPHRRPNGKLDIEVDTEALNLKVATESRARYIVLLNRGQQRDKARLDSCSAAEAARRLNSLVCYGDERIRGEQKRALDVFLRLPAVTLTYGDPAAAEEALRDLAA